MTRTIAIAPVRKTVSVDVSQTEAFDVFTDGVDRWWPKNHCLGDAPVVKEVIEPRLGGRWYALHEDGKETTISRMLVWDPPRRIVFSWEVCRSGQWKAESDQAVASEVEVRFVAETPTRTRVELEHRNFERMGDESSARKMRDSVDNGWPGILDVFRKVAEG